MDRFLISLFFWSNQIKIYHLQTKVYAMHVALGDLYDKLTDFTDDFAEKFMANGDVLQVSSETRSIENYMDMNQVFSTLDEITDYFLTIREELEEDTDLQNMLDEIIGSINKTKYLLTLS